MALEALLSLGVKVVKELLEAVVERLEGVAIELIFEGLLDIGVILIAFSVFCLRFSQFMRWFE